MSPDATLTRISTADPFEPAVLGSLRLRNRVIKAATYEGMSPGGVPTPALAELHRALAASEVGLTTVAYCAVSEGGRTFPNQLWLQPAAHEPLRKLTRAVHDEGGAVSLQLAHAGMFSKLRGPSGRGPRGPSFAWNAYGAAAGLPFARAMTPHDIEKVIDDFGRSAAIAVELGFDALELHLGHGYLLSQFLSPAVNRRADRWGGSLENRLRLPLAVAARVREAVGRDVAVIAKMNLSDGFEGGLTLEDAVAVAKALEASGAVDLLIPSGGFTSRTPFYLLRGGLPLREMAAAQPDALSRLAMRSLGGLIVGRYEFEEGFFREQAARVRAAVRMPVALLGGLVSVDALRRAIGEGFDFVVLGRALVADPDLVSRMRSGELERTRCNACNRCVAEMDRGGVRCVL
jgi:2,4-dienoyl-CoA reductase-like NADH-dependent reductase (Old Yellow Enzyme family)